MPPVARVARLRCNRRLSASVMASASAPPSRESPSATLERPIMREKQGQPGSRADIERLS